MTGTYRPNRAELTDHFFPVVLGEHRGYVIDVWCRQSVYKTQCRDFALKVRAFDAEGSEYEVLTVDTCHAELHRHIGARSNDSHRSAERRLIYTLDAGDEPIVDKAFQTELDLICSTWEQIAERWYRR